MNKATRLPSFNGYFSFPKFILLSVRDKAINTSQLSAYLIIAGLTEFHLDNPLFGYVNKSYAEIAVSLNVSPSTAERWVEKLVIAGLLSWQTPRGYTGSILVCRYFWALKPPFTSYLARLHFENWEKTTYILNRYEELLCNVNFASMHDIHATLHEITSRFTGSNFIVPYKGKYLTNNPNT